MAHRTILTARQRAALFDLPTDEASILYHYTLSDDDLEHINVRRRSENRFGYALQLCALRHPGRLLSSREVIPEPVVRFVGAQLGMTGDEILPYAARRQTRQQHLHDLRQGVDKTWGSCGAFSVCDGQPTIENCGPCDGYSVSPFGRPPHPSALSHAGIGNVID